MAECVFIRSYAPESTKVKITGTVSPSGYGTISGLGEYEKGTTVSLTATRVEGHSFIKWDDNSISKSRTFTATSNKRVTATFATPSISVAKGSKDYLVTVTVSNCESELASNSLTVEAGSESKTYPLTKTDANTWTSGEINLSDYFGNNGTYNFKALGYDGYNVDTDETINIWTLHTGDFYKLTANNVDAQGNGCYIKSYYPASGTDIPYKVYQSIPAINTSQWFRSWDGNSATMVNYGASSASWDGHTGCELGFGYEIRPVEVQISYTTKGAGRHEMGVTFNTAATNTSTAVESLPEYVKTTVTGASAGTATLTVGSDTDPAACTLATSMLFAGFGVKGNCEGVSYIRITKWWSKD